MRRGWAATILCAVLVAPPVAARSLSLILETVDMRDRQDGFAVRTFDGIVRSVARTRDGGRSFVDVASLDDLGLRGARTIAALDGRTVLIGGDGWVLRSTDGGRTLSRVEVPADLSYRKLELAGATATGWLLGVAGDERPSGAIFLTLDAGRTFRARTAARDASFRDFAFVDPARGWAVDDRGVVRTRDGGASFEPVAGAPAGRYSAVAARGRLVLAATASRVARSSDDGARWDFASLPTDGEVRSLQIVDERRWVVVVDGDAAYRTSDAGANWALLSAAPGHGPPRFLDDRQAYAGGSDTLYVSQDAGDSWHAADPRHQEDVETEERAATTRTAAAEADDTGSEAAGPGAEPPGRAGRRRGAEPVGRAGTARGGGEGEGEEDSEVLRAAQDRGVPQGALQRARRAAERMQRHGRTRGSDWIKGVRHRRR